MAHCLVRWPETVERRSLRGAQPGRDSRDPGHSQDREMLFPSIPGTASGGGNVVDELECRSSSGSWRPLHPLRGSLSRTWWRRRPGVERRILASSIALRSPHTYLYLGSTGRPRASASRRNLLSLIRACDLEFDFGQRTCGRSFIPQLRFLDLGDLWLPLHGGKW